MKSVCKYCAQKEVGCSEECADRRAERAERKERRKAIKIDELLMFPKTSATTEASATMNGVIFVPIRR